MKTKHPKPIRRKPKTNWRAIEVIDLKQSDPLFLYELTCDRCNQPLRFVHVLSRPGESEEFIAGRCCASRLCSSYDPVASERQLTNRWNRRMKFPDLAGWKTSRSGNPYLRSYHNASVTIFRQDDGWRFVILSNERHFSPRDYPTIRDAKLAAFDYLDCVC